MSFYTSLSGLKNAQTGLSVTANNIANAETLGFKKSRTLFSDLVTGSNPKMQLGIGSTVQSITQNQSMGPLEQTGGALDLAINGEGFFTKKNPISGETMYTRSGAFSVDDNGFVKDGSGNRLQIFEQPVQPAPPAAPVEIDPATDTPVDLQLPKENAAHSPFAGVTLGNDGTIKVSFADGSNETLGKVALAQFSAVDGLKQTGSSNWVATGISGSAEYGLPGGGIYGSLSSGTLERSNVDITEELVGLITMQRYFQANAKAIDTASQISQTVLNLRT